MTKDLKHKSKFLSLVLRHDPGSIGLVLDEAGWADIDALIAAAPFALDRAEIEEITRTSDKKRFAISEDGTRIRANQGHSVEVDLQMAQASPPAQLYHGTATRFLPLILEQGLSRQERHHVHLSSDQKTAVDVGARHGKPVILQVAAAEMAAAGHLFFLSENQVWLTEAVPADFLTVLPT